MYNGTADFLHACWMWVPSEFDGFQGKSTTLFYFPWNIHDQAAVEVDESARIELQTDKWLGANGLYIDLHGAQNGIPVTSLVRVKRSNYLSF